MFAILQSECGVPASELASWPYKLFGTGEFDEPANRLVDGTRAVANARVISAVMRLDPLEQGQKADLVSLPSTPMANTVVATWLLSSYEYQPIHDKVFPALAKGYLLSRGLCHAAQ
ncbi:hypothetical protein [Cupriavidus respiraculi]|nr:hypothetical protein [Cupriavidus respiraculi]MBY4949551.1 hypothetical protein [Cupriavidus respiraculi]